MRAKTKLNTAYINGSLIGGGLIGLGFESMTAFVIATIFFNWLLLLQQGHSIKEIKYEQ